MKRKIWKRRRDGVRQRYTIGRKRKFKRRMADNPKKKKPQKDEDLVLDNDPDIFFPFLTASGKEVNLPPPSRGAPKENLPAFRRDPKTGKTAVYYRKDGELKEGKPFISKKREKQIEKLIQKSPEELGVKDFEPKEPLITTPEYEAGLGQRAQQNVDKYKTGKIVRYTDDLLSRLLSDAQRVGDAKFEKKIRKEFDRRQSKRNYDSMTTFSARQQAEMIKKFREDPYDDEHFNPEGYERRKKQR